MKMIEKMIGHDICKDELWKNEEKISPHSLCYFFLTLLGSYGIKRLFLENGKKLLSNPITEEIFNEFTIFLFLQEI